VHPGIGRAKWVYYRNVIFGLSIREVDACGLCGWITILAKCGV
jgi:hypothetical protein